MDQRVGITEDSKAQSVAQDLKSQGSRSGGPKFRVSKFQAMGYGLLLIAGLDSSNRVLRETELSIKKRASAVDRMAAMLILQNWMEARDSTRNF